jgi:UDP-glucose 4-epimerase
VVVLDNLENSHLEVLHRVRILAAAHHTALDLPLAAHPPLYFHSCDVQDRSALAAVFALYATGPRRSRIVSAIHFAALKSVAGSLSDPLSYYQINVGGTLNLAGILAQWDCKKLVFSSSCVVYGAEADGEGIMEEQLDVRQGASKGITNPCEYFSAGLDAKCEGSGADARGLVQMGGRSGCARRFCPICTSVWPFA